MTSGPIRVGTRSSLLALAQTALVVSAWSRVDPRARFVVVPITSQGDRDRRSVEGLDFTDAIDRALEAGQVDLAVHSSKDLPAVPARRVRLAIFLPRADPRDALVLREARSLRSLPRQARIGSSSPRRRAQLLRARPDLRVVELRGNVDTRLAAVRSAKIDGAVLALAGLRRLGRGGEATERLDLRRFLPAPGQGAIAVAVRAGERRWARVLARLDDARTRQAVEAERALVRALGADCRTPLGALGRVRSGRLTLVGELLAPDGSRSVRARLRGPARRSSLLGRRLGRKLLEGGGRELLPASARGPVG